MLSCREETWNRFLLATCVEPLRHLHNIFLKSAHAPPVDNKWPQILQELNPAVSRGHAVARYYSSLLGNVGSRLQLLWRLDDADTFEDIGE